MTTWSGANRIDVKIAAYLSQVGDVFRVFTNRDSHCTAYGVSVGGARWFVKHSDDPRGIASLQRAIDVDRRVRHPALPALAHTLTTPHGLALVYPWVPGEPLYYSSSTPPEQRRDPTVRAFVDAWQKAVNRELSPSAEKR